MKKISYFAAGTAIAMLAAGCSSFPKMGSVIPQPGNTYEVVSTGLSEKKALDSALYSAASTCKSRQMRHVVTSQKTTYKGMASESTNNILNKAADIVGPFAWIPTLSGDDDYQTSLAFKCES